jgi:hypothetical protein
LRFQRRETFPRDPVPYVGKVNLETWIIMDGVWLDPQTALCTRVESETQDGGLSYLVTFEFQVKGLVNYPNGSYLVYPVYGIGNAGPGGAAQISPWTVGAYYTLSVGEGRGPTNVISTKNVRAILPGEAPPDASPFFFQIYEAIDFEHDPIYGLHLSGY